MCCGPLVLQQDLYIQLIIMTLIMYKLSILQQTVHLSAPCRTSGPYQLSATLLWMSSLPHCALQWRLPCRFCVCVCVCVCVFVGSRLCVMMMMMMRVTPRAEADQRSRQDPGWGSSSSSIRTSSAATKGAQCWLKLDSPLLFSRVWDAPARRQDVRLVGPPLGASCRARCGVLGSVWQPTGRHQLLQKAMPAHHQKQKPR